jgi:hypothetical protein
MFDLSTAHHLICLKRAAEFARSLKERPESELAHQIMEWFELNQKSTARFHALKLHPKVTGARAQEILQEMRCLLGRLTVEAFHHPKEMM